MTIANLLKCGEKLDDLVAKSEDLSSQSKLFCKTAMKIKKCIIGF
jgi:synaptobrevin family protein YKT6